MRSSGHPRTHRRFLASTHRADSGRTRHAARWPTVPAISAAALVSRRAMIREIPLQAITPACFTVFVLNGSSWRTSEGLLTNDGGSDVRDSVGAFLQAGYSLYLEKVFAQGYGVPQRRKRVLIVGNRLGCDFLFPEPVTQAFGAASFAKGEITFATAVSGSSACSNRSGQIALRFLNNRETNCKPIFCGARLKLCLTITRWHCPIFNLSVCGDCSPARR